MEKLFSEKISGSGTPVVFLHGLLDSSQSYLEMGKNIKNPAILIDLPGFGRSSIPGSLSGFKDWVDAIEKTIRSEVTGEYHILGHSLGGAIASKIADRDDRVKSLVLISSAGYAKLPLARPLALPLSEKILLQTAPRAMGSELVIKSFYWTVFSHFKGIDPGLLERLIKERHRSADGAKLAMRAILEISNSPFKENSYQGPVTVIWGDQDFLTPRAKSIENIEKIFKDPDIHILKNTGHHPQDEQKEQVTKIIKSVVGRQTK